MNEKELLEIPYTKFVDGLFLKPADTLGKILHAIIGMMGEAVELQNAMEHDNFLEELGDYEFYMEAFYLHAPAIPGLRKDFAKIPVVSVVSGVDLLVTETANVLDQVKKHWIYAKPWDKLEIEAPLDYCYQALVGIYKCSGISAQEVNLRNRKKLIKRYPGATYSDAAAQARADKPAGQ